MPPTCEKRAGSVVASIEVRSHVSDLWHQRIVRVGVCKQRANRQQHLRRTAKQNNKKLNRTRRQHQTWSHAQGQGMVDTFGMAAHVTFETVKAGLHCSFRISRHMLPLELMLGWYTFVAKLTCHRARIDVRLCRICGLAGVTMRNSWHLTAVPQPYTHARSQQSGRSTFGGLNG